MDKLCSKQTPFVFLHVFNSGYPLNMFYFTSLANIVDLKSEFAWKKHHLFHKTFLNIQYLLSLCVRIKSKSPPLSMVNQMYKAMTS